MRQSFLVHIDENGDAAGNYTILGTKLISNSKSNTSTYGLFPFGTFITKSSLGENGSQSIPVSEMKNMLTTFKVWGASDAIHQKNIPLRGLQQKCFPWMQRENHSNLSLQRQREAFWISCF